VKRMAVGALSAMRYAPARNALEAELGDTNPAIRYDSAVALARLKDGKAAPTLLEMMALKPTGQPDDITQSAKLAGIEGALELPDPQLRGKVEELAKDDPDIKVKEAALQALKR
jgi:HEAT repeat protein